MKKSEYAKTAREHLEKLFRTSAAADTLQVVLQMELLERAWCPVCEHDLSEQDEGEGGIISYSGDTYCITCENCGTELSVEESVVRQYDVTVLQEDDDGELQEAGSGV